MQRHRPRPIQVLTLVFAWTAFRGVQSLVRGSVEADRILFDQVGMGWIATPVVVVVLILDLAAIWFLLWPRRAGLFICLASIGLSAVHTSVATFLGLQHPNALRQAMVVSREARGLPVREGAVEMAQDPRVAGLTLILLLAVSAVLALIVLRNRSYFAPQVESSTRG